jgi:hypothetical protein
MRMTRSRWAYRLRQGLTRLSVALRPGMLDDSPARARLSPQAWELFARMAPGDRAHGLCVLARLEAQGDVPAPLAEAALLHDVGKVGGRLSLPYRTAVVLLGARLAGWASADRASWRYPFYAHLEHAERGAALCAEAGCDPHTVALVRWHETSLAEIDDASLYDHLAALQAADDQC